MKAISWLGRYWLTSPLVISVFPEFLSWVPRVWDGNSGLAAY